MLRDLLGAHASELGNRRDENWLSLPSFIGKREGRGDKSNTSTSENMRPFCTKQKLLGIHVQCEERYA